jgi:hypothetical protein
LHIWLSTIVHTSLAPQSITAKATCSDLTLQLFLILAVFAESHIYNLVHRGQTVLRYSFLSSSFPQILHSQFSHPANSVGTMINYAQIGLLSVWKYAHLVFINFIQYLFNACFITHSILCHGLFQFISCYVPTVINFVSS